MLKYLILASATMLATSLHAENAQLLESFESGVSGVSLLATDGGRPARTPPGVTLSQYSKTGAGDENVTEGDKSLKVVLSGSGGFSADFQIQLSPGASDKVRQAAASTDVARYILRYDVIFPSMKEFDYFNSGVQIGSSHYALISTGGKRSLSIPLDLVKGLPENGPITLEISDDFGHFGAFTNVALYLDNIRLVDNYAPGAKPVTQVLQSFEDPKDPMGGVTINTNHWGHHAPVLRTAFAQYTATAGDYPRVSDGHHALEVTDTNPPAWQPDFIVPFKGTALAKLLKPDSGQQPTREELSHYTPRWDVTCPDLAPGEWVNFTYLSKNFLPIFQTDNQTKGQRLTYSITLDQVDWDDSGDGNPVLSCILQGPQKTNPVKFYYDNFRLIDTGHADSKP
jgi:hypothetical protein